MKIVFLNITGTLGGAELCLLDLLAALRPARPAWRLEVLLGAEGPLRGEVERLGVPCAVLPLPAAVARLGDAGLRDRSGRSSARGRLALAARAPAAAGPAAAYWTRLRRALRAAAPDWVQTNNMKAHVLGTSAAPRGVPVVWHLHDFIATRPVMARLLRLAASATSRRVVGVAVSRAVAADAAGVLGKRVAVRPILNAVDLNRFAPESGGGDCPAVDLDAAAGLGAAPAGIVRVGLVATFARWKGQDLFLEAIARIPAERPSRFYIVGGPIYRSIGSQWTMEELRARAEALGVAKRVGFTGFQDPAAAMRALDVVVHASTRPEPFGRVIAEGMACGRAVVAIRDGGSAELFDDGITALGCPREDPAALAAAIDRLILDGDLRRRMGQQGRDAAVQRFDRNNLTQPWADLYETQTTGSAHSDSTIQPASP